MAFFGNLRRRKNTTRKAVYSAAIDFDRSKAERMRLGDLSPSGRYRLQNNESTNEQQIITYDEIKRFVVDVVNNELKSKCQGYLDIPIESITVRDTHEGSIVVLFTVLLNVFQFLGSIKDFHDSIELIKDIANEHIKIRLAQRYGGLF